MMLRGTPLSLINSERQSEQLLDSFFFFFFGGPRGPSDGTTERAGCAAAAVAFPRTSCNFLEAPEDGIVSRLTSQVQDLILALQRLQRVGGVGLCLCSGGIGCGGGALPPTLPRSNAAFSTTAARFSGAAAGCCTGFPQHTPICQVVMKYDKSTGGFTFYYIFGQIKKTKMVRRRVCIFMGLFIHVQACADACLHVCQTNASLLIKVLLSNHAPRPAPMQLGRPAPMQLGMEF